jgi:hypothetical protein
MLFYGAPSPDRDTNEVADVAFKAVVVVVVMESQQQLTLFLFSEFKI